MKKMFLLFSHTLTPIQKSSAKKILEITEFVSLPKELQAIWSNIPPDVEDLQAYLKPIKDYLKDSVNSNDIILIQGDFGAGYSMINYVKTLGLQAYYATTKRNVEEKEIDGKILKRSIFEHVMFREYL